MKTLLLYDTTLRDGAQSDGVDFSVRDKLKITDRLDAFGLDYIEGGWPGANSVDTAYFEEMRHRDLKHARLAAFGSTRRAGVRAEDDITMQAIARSCATVATIFGKSCPHHVKIALGIEDKVNLEIIEDSVGYLTRFKEQVVYDAEHFFDGFMRSPDYALATLCAAQEAGAHSLVLCDTNGGTMPEDVALIVKRVQEEFPEARIGIHAHNDCGLAVANSLAAVDAGALMIQGTINGIGERCGNANLCTVMPNILLKKKEQYTASLGAEKMAELHSLAAAVSDIANQAPRKRDPFVGEAAFAHKGGVHVSAINKNSSLYEHLDPALVGNSRRILMSQQGGKSNVVALAKRLQLTLPPDGPALTAISDEIKEKAAQGYDFAAAEASVELLLLQHLGRVPDFFSIKRFYVINAKTERDPVMEIEACLKLDVQGLVAHTAASGLGPVDALEKALRRALLPTYPELERLNLTDYKVRVLAGQGRHTASVGPDSVRVLIDAADGTGVWSTVGVSADLIEASWQALVDSVVYFLCKERGLLTGD